MRPIDITRLYQDYGVSTAPPGSKHYLSGWVNTHCPFCKGASHHLGYHEQTGHFNCWKCGFKPVFFALSGVLKQHSSKIRALVRLYYRKEDTLEHDPETIPIRSISTCKPPDLSPLKRPQIDFLKRRKFDPSYLEEKYLLKAFGPVSFGGFAHRIFIPIFFNGDPVSWYARTIVENKPDKYRPCPKEKERIHHKEILYNWDNAKGSSCVLVEGVTDVWRLGDGSLAAFGIVTTPKQRALIHKRFRRVFILFDADENEAGQIAGEKLAYLLSGGSLEVKQVFLEKGDPGDMKQEDADALMKELL